MKKLFVLFGLSFFGMASLSMAMQDRFGNMRDEIGRSSVTLTNDANVCIASGPIVLIRVSVDTPGTASNIEFFDSSVSSAGARRPVAPIATTSQYNGKYGVIFSSGLVYNSTGSAPASVTIIWDWLTKTFPR